MKVLFSVILYFSIIFSFLQNLWLLLLVSLAVFSLQFGAMALIPAAIVIDGYFGNYYDFPYLSIMAIGWFILVEYVRPKVIDLDQETI